MHEENSGAAGKFSVHKKDKTIKMAVKIGHDAVLVLHNIHTCVFMLLV